MAKRFKPPTFEECREYQALHPELANVDIVMFFHGFNDADWIDTQGKPVRNWKLKMWTWSRFAEKHEPSISCLVCHSKDDCKYQLDKEGKRIYLCAVCAAACTLILSNWGWRTKTQIEKIVEQGKALQANPPKPKGKDRELVQADKASEALRRLTSNVADSMKP